MTEAELPTDAAEADALEQQTDLVADPDDGFPAAMPSEPPTEADPADVADQRREVSLDPDDYDDSEL